MELLSVDFFYALVSIIIIDLVLGGDNAIIIGMAARNLPRKEQKKAIIWGTAGAVLVRVIATLLVVWLLKIPGLMLAGGLVLIWMAFKLLNDDKKDLHVKEGISFRTAIRNIIIADAAMGLDNVLAIAGAAHNNFVVVVIGLLISVPIVVWGSTMVLKLIERYPFIIYLGSAVIAYTAGTMIVEEPLIHPLVQSYAYLEWTIIVLAVLGVIITGKLKTPKNQ